MGIFDFLDIVLDFVFNPLLNLGYFVSILVIAFLVALMMVLVQPLILAILEHSLVFQFHLLFL